ncbi:site-2 protease family protein [Patescibacteria group bacterium]|nr:site-2 protease family protein [Patescibacteria group bacterium]
MLFTLIIFVVILSLLVFVHELGHFYTARKFGVTADEFGFGFPPRICGWKKINGKRKFFWGNGDPEKIKSEDTIYSINWIPLGGFVRIKGEDGLNKEDPDSFANKKIWKRAIILSAGVAMNIVLCAFCLSIAFMIGAPQVVDEQSAGAVSEQKIQIISIIPDSAAEKIDLQIGDSIIDMNGTAMTDLTQVQNYISERNNQTIKIKIDRIGEIKEMEFTPAVIAETGKPSLGVGLAKTGIVSYPWYKAIWLGLVGTYSMFIQIIIAFATIIKNALIGAPIGMDVAGPVGIAAMTGRVARLGFVYILQFTALLSMNLAIINFLPFPALDGGRVFLLLVEKIRGRAINQRIEQIIHTIGFGILLLLIVVVTGRDVLKFKEFFVNIWQKVIG